jgi:dipicolinate synthase subunit A
MREAKLFAVVGADARQQAAAQALRRMGCRAAGAEATAQADYILLPLPLDGDRAGLARLLRAARPGAVALGGRVSAEAAQAAAAAHIELIDYFARPELAELNAIPTAEGCISLLLQKRTRTLWGSPVLVVGFGRVGRALACRLAALGAAVTAAARRPEQRAMALSLGCAAAADTAALEAAAAGFDTVVNTAPAPLLTAQVLAALAPHSLVIDLASRPGGTDFAAAQALGHTALHALSLPAACAPDSAGEYVARTVLEILRERGETV